MRDDVFLHQYNFSNWMPSPVRALAVDNFSGIVAVGRQDGEIELMGPNHKWHTQARVSGKSDFDLSGLAFSQVDEEAGRLFGATLQGFVFEVDIATLTLKNIRDSYGGTVWAMAVSKRGAVLGLGCEDGTVKLFSFANSQLDYQKSMSATGSRILSVCFHPVDARVYAGCADGTIRCYNETTGSNLFRIVGDVQKGSMCSIWSLVVLQDFTLISGDNHGRVQFWNGYSGNELLSTHHQHASTILSLVVNEKEDAVFASGEDSRVICLRRLISRGETSSSIFPSSSDQKRHPLLESMLNCQWVYTSSHRPHSHDVRSLAIATQIGPNSQPKPVLISGGVDSKLCMYSVDDFTGSRPSWILPIPARGITAASSNSKILAVKHRTYLDIWDLNHPTLPSLNRGGHVNTLPSIDKSALGCSLACRIQLKDGVSRDYFHSIALTNDGELLAATGGAAQESDSLDSLCGLRLWHLTRSSQDSDIVAVKVQLSDTILELLADDLTCQSLAFSSDGRSLCVTLCGSNVVKLVLLDIEKPHRKNNNQYQVSIRHIINHTKQIKARRQRENGSLSNGTRSSNGTLIEKMSSGISLVTYSADGQWLGVCSCDKLVFIYEIDRLSLHWEMPSFESSVSCIAFHPQSPNSLVVVLSGDNSFHIFDVQDKTLTPWSLVNKDLIPSWASSLGKAASGPVMNISFDPTCASAFVLHGQAFSIYVNLDRPLPSPIESRQVTSNAEFSPQVVTHSMLSSASALPSKVDLIQKELQELSPTDHKFLKKRKKLQKLLDEETKLTSADGDEVSEVVKKSKKTRMSSAATVPQANEMRNFSLLKSHRSIVYLSILNSNEMVVVENPWVRVLENLPETLARKRYGA